MSLLTYFLTHRKGPAPVDRKALTMAERDRAQLVQKAQRIKLESLQKLNTELADNLKVARDRLSAKLEKIDDETLQEYDRLVSDDRALLERIDSLLGTTTEWRRGGSKG